MESCSGQRLVGRSSPRGYWRSEGGAKRQLGLGTAHRRDRYGQARDAAGSPRLRSEHARTIEPPIAQREHRYRCVQRERMNRQIAKRAKNGDLLAAFGGLAVAFSSQSLTNRF